MNTTLFAGSSGPKVHPLAIWFFSPSISLAHSFLPPFSSFMVWDKEKNKIKPLMIIYYLFQKLTEAELCFRVAQLVGMLSDYLCLPGMLQK